MKQFSLRGFLTGVSGLLVITASSMYVALRMGALPWPTVFVTVLSMVVLGRAKNISLQEINVTHTFMSSGAMVAGGLAFTLPGIWMVNPDAEIPFLAVLFITASGAVLGTVFCSFYRKGLIESKNLVFPIGKAAYQTLKAGVKKGRYAFKLFASMAFSIVFTVFRDLLSFIPSVFTLVKGSSKIPQINFWLSPMALAIGAVIDRLSALCWFAGSIISYFVLAPFGADELFRQNLGIGLMIGTGAGILIKFAFRTVGKHSFVSVERRKELLYGLATVFLIAVFLSLFTEISIFQSLLAVLLVGISCLLCGMLTGQSGINPMEIFGILVMLAVGVAGKTSVTGLFLVAAMTAVACGLSGDVMNDLKSGHLLRTDFRQQLFSELVGGVIGSVLSVIALFAMKKTFGNFGTEFLPAPQAKAVASMATGLGNSIEFFAGIVIGAVLYVAGLPSATIGLGIYLPAQISMPVGVGAIIAMFCRKSVKVKDEDISLVASGFLGGEGISGVLIAIFSMF